jgi:hypothetical protein
MKKSTLKKVLIYGLSSFVFLFFVLAIHIYLVYRPAPDAFTKVMARIDIKQPLTPQDANNIAGWMYKQKGIDHVVVNPESNTVIFTFFPVKTNGTQVVDNLKKALNLKADRYMPDAQTLNSGCPVSKSSYTYKIYKLITQVI